MGSLPHRKMGEGNLGRGSAFLSLNDGGGNYFTLRVIPIFRQNRQVGKSGRLPRLLEVVQNRIDLARWLRREVIECIGSRDSSERVKRTKWGRVSWKVGRQIARRWPVVR